MDEILKGIKTITKNIEEKDLSYDELKEIEEELGKLHLIIISIQMQFSQYYEVK